MSDEGALRNQRIEFVRESTIGTVPTDPSYNLYSDNVTNISWSPSAGLEQRRGIGSADITTFHNGPEEHEVTVTYDMQDFLVDGSGTPVDAAGDGVVRDGDNDLQNTHHFLFRETNSAIPSGETVEGANSLDTRLYLVGKGARVDSVTMTGDPGSDQAVVVELTYMAEKVREYQIDQPGASNTIAVESTDTNDTSQTLTVEDQGASTSETLTLNGTTTVTGSSNFDNVDALELDAETAGDVKVWEYDSSGSSKVNQIATIKGSTSYGGVEGDLGVPALGSGSHASAIGSSYEIILDDSIDHGGNAYGYELNSVEFSVENNVDTREQIGSIGMALSAGNREGTVTATVVGPTESVKNADDHLTNTSANVKWTLDGGFVELTNARLTDFGGIDKSSGESAMSLDNTFTGESVNTST